MKLTYWHIQHQTDADCYSIRAKTKREALRQAKEHWNDTDYALDTVKKVTVEYADSFDLLTECLSEGGPYWEYARN